MRAGYIGLGHMGHAQATGHGARTRPRGVESHPPQGQTTSSSEERRSELAGRRRRSGGRRLHVSVRQRRHAGGAHCARRYVRRGKLQGTTIVDCTTNYRDAAGRIHAMCAEHASNTSRHPSSEASTRSPRPARLLRKREPGRPRQGVPLHRRLARATQYLHNPVTRRHEAREQPHPRHVDGRAR